MTVVVPSLERLSKEGEVGQQKITQYTRYLTVGLAFPSRSATSTSSSRSRAGGHEHRRDPDVPEADDDRDHAHRGLHAADVARRADHPARHRQRHLADDLRLDRLAASRTGIQAWWTNPDQVFVVMMPFIALAVIVGIVYVQEGQRRIPVQYAKRVVGRRMTTGGQTYLPLRVNMAGVIPVIFAASIMAFPPTIGQLLNTPAALDFAAFFSPQRLGLRRRRGASSSSSSPTSTPRSRSTRSTRPRTSRSTAASSRGQTRTTYRRIPGQDPVPAHLPGSPVLRRRRSLADDPHQPDLGELLLRRNLDPDRRRRRPRHGEAARGAADDAQLRGLPEVTAPRALARGRRAPAVTPA